jgi:hypothetical protein
VTDRGSSADPARPHLRLAWRPAAGSAAGCLGDHGRSTGRLDESARRLSHEEIDVARQLASEGHQVRSLAERPGLARTADLLVCDSPLEVKSWPGRQARGRPPPGPRSVFNKLAQAEEQAPAVVINGRGSGLTTAAARIGMAAYVARRRPQAVRCVRILGDGFDLGWIGVARWRSPQEGLTAGPGIGSRTRRAAPTRRPDLPMGPDRRIGPDLQMGY